MTAEDLLIKNISYRWINTDMGSGYEFSLYSPYHREIIEYMMYFDEYDEELYENYEEYQKELYNWSFLKFRDMCNTKYLHYFIESLQTEY